MKYPKQKDQMKLIGTLCSFTRELRCVYFKNGTRRWTRGLSPYNCKTQQGKIVGFGCTYNGKYIPKSGGYFDSDDTDANYAYFKPTKRITHIKVRTKGEGKALKIHPMDCKIIKENK